MDGEADVMTEDTTHRVRAGDEAIFLPRRHQHQLKGIHGVKTFMRERTRPTGRFKEEQAF